MVTHYLTHRAPSLQSHWPIGPPRYAQLHRHLHRDSLLDGDCLEVDRQLQGFLEGQLERV